MSKSNHPNTIAQNKKAYFEYEVIDKYTAGLVLLGTEIKSIRNRAVSLTGGHCYFRGTELFVTHLSIKEYENAGFVGHDPMRDKKLLLSKKELKKLKQFTDTKGNTIIPLKLFMSDKQLAKLEIGACRGKKLYDKREDIKDRESKIITDRVLKYKSKY